MSSLGTRSTEMCADIETLDGEPLALFRNQYSHVLIRLVASARLTV